MNPNRRLVKKFQLLQITPANGVRAVMSVDQPDGIAQLTAVDCDYVGVATVTSSIMETQPDGDEAATNSQHHGNLIVGVVIENGLQRILDASSNFCGLVMPGQSIEQCTGQASEAVLEKIKASAEQPSPEAKQSKPQPVNTVK